MKNYFVHEKGICESFKIGKNTKIWAFAHILKGAVIGSGCNICDGVFIENDVRVDDRVTIKCGVQLWDGITVEDDVFIGPGAAFTNDKFPRSRIRPEKFLKTTVKKGASIGANATILPGLEIGERSMVGAGSVVTMSVPPYAVVSGNPARIIRYIDAGKEKSGLKYKKTEKIIKSRVKGAALYNLRKVEDMRGTLSVAEFQKEFPFVPKRYFVVYNVPSERIRGRHAHKKCGQFLICINGSVSVVLDDGKSRSEYALDRPNAGLYIPPMVWGVQYKYSKDAVLLVFASHKYDKNDYIRNYDDWKKALRK